MDNNESSQDEIKMEEEEIDGDETTSEKCDEHFEENRTELNAIIKEEVDLMCDAQVKSENMAFLNANSIEGSSTSADGTYPSFEEVIIKENRVDFDQNGPNSDTKLSKESRKYDWCRGCRKAFERGADSFTSDTCKQCEQKTLVAVPYNKQKPYLCYICKKTFRASCILTVHMRTHRNEKPYKCHVCDRRFSNMACAKAHMATHSNEKPYKCQICDRAFKASYSAKMHMRTHTNEKPYQCQVCERTFSQSSSVIAHMRTHTNEKPYKCQVCEKTFAKSSSVKIHMRTHTNEKPYKCEVCEKRFNHASNYRIHMYSHNPDGPPH